MSAGFVIMASDFAAVFLLIYGLKRMASPVTARTGIIIAGMGMLVAILASFLYALEARATAAAHLPINAEIAAIALVAGVSWAWWRGRTVAITAMPQMVALYNGMGGGAAAAIAAAELVAGGERASTALGVTVLGALIGTTSLAGSLVAWAKLDGRIKRPWRFRGQRFCNTAVLILALASGASLVVSGAGASGITALFFLAALVLGAALTLPIGGADMPVVIALFNAFTGLAVGLEGFVLENPAIMIAGMVVGSAGTLLTLRMA
ncbi:MAG TPA: NAD(P)(+) transhydrogenase (Re/Si-specific) subunit beta, partial [Steroidobacteraceae bacterium]|nr:NAD(P)(+) transhydrogenase (Re/Si-specific) subunit beta [Steroidobacteraceae bacterium]